MLPSLPERYECTRVHSFRKESELRFPVSLLRIFSTFSPQLKADLYQASDAGLQDMKDDLSEWERILASIQNTARVATDRDKLNNEDIPALKSQIKEQESKLPEVSQVAEEVGPDT